MGKTLVKVVATPVGASHEKIVAHFDDDTTSVVRARATLLRDYRWAAQHSRHGSLEHEVTLHARRDLAVPYRALRGDERRDTVVVVEVARG